ncbi:HAD-IA family hydrolase [Saccharothrix obliqua]|uniref:HAD-IA family hydrolase n=1 Tax=Saccharothrix obliqua TaxID=2861747 RepID=UPI001C607C1F|nr:HAD-IA family hydrolase [Saccharothrix obliqua]MBW4715665.1 HAD-IA family hydrolase [Saccharothrix obliqua]
MSRWVVFDYGMVISEPSTAHGDLARVLGVPEPAFLPAYWAHRHDYDAGLPAVDYWRAVGRDVGVEVDAERAARLTDLDTAGWLNAAPDAVALVADLADAGVPLALLSNAPAEFGRRVAAQPWTGHFRHLMFSGELGVAKPAPEVWSVLTARLGSTDCVFFDDNEANIAGARAAGLTAVHWRHATHARAELRDLGVLP